MSDHEIQALLFDKDGTLFDFEKSWGAFGRRVIYELAAGEPRLMRALAEAAGVDPETGGFRPGSPIVAGANAEIVAAWIALLPQWEADELEGWLRLEAEKMDPRFLVPAAPELAALLDGLLAEGYALGVATNDAEAAARRQLGALEARFAFIAGYDSGFGQKPEPGPVLAFADAVGRRPAEIAMIGDSVHDLAAARAAGCAAAIGVLTGPARREDLAADADAVLDSIADLPAWLAARRGGDGAP